MTLLTNLNIKINEINYKINQFESKISKKENFCCRSCPNLIHEIESDLKKLVNGEKNLRKKQVIVFKKNLKSTQKRWTALSRKLIKEIPNRCMQNVFADPTRILKKIGRCLPNLAIIGAGVSYLPSFRIGCLAGIANLGAKICVLNVLKKLKIPMGSSKNSEYAKSIKEASPINVGLIGPIVEEVIFRKGFQPIGLVPSSVLFGLMHAFNPHEGAITQAILTTFSGLLYNYLAENYGMAAPIAAHILNNTLAYLLSDLFSLEK